MSRSTVCAALIAAASLASGLASAQVADDQLDPSALLNYSPHALGASEFAAAGGSGVLGKHTRSGLLGIDSIPNFSSYFYRNDSPLLYSTYDQFTWPYTMVGNAPKGSGDDDDEGRTTWIGAPVVPVTVELLNFDGTPRFVNGHPMISTSTQYVNPVLNSPVFAAAHYSSSNIATQFTDAVHRAQFFNMSDREWHTLLRARATAPRSIKLIRGNYSFSVNPDGTCCRFILVDINAFTAALFPATAGDSTSPVGFAETTGLIRQNDISTFLFNNVFLYFGTTANCCVVGFHTYDGQPGNQANGFKEKRFVLTYASWVSPGVFRDPTFADVAALSHEMMETFSDPFVNNATPYWLSPSGLCQNNLESADVIEGLANPNSAISTNGVIYHVQNEALLQWFAGRNPSNAIGGAYSYPNTSLLTSSAAVHGVNCP